MAGQQSEPPVGFSLLTGDESGVDIVAPGDTDCLVVTFGGIMEGIGFPAFEFANVLAEFECNRAFLRDQEQAWYHRGVVGAGNTMEEVAAFLGKAIRAHGRRRTVFVGNSMGGYAAILFGAWLGVDSVIAFGPQTFLGPIQRLFHRDFRWRRQLRRVYIASLQSTAYLDLLPWCRGCLRETQVEIYYGSGGRLDEIHANRLSSLAGVQIRAVEAASHDAVRRLRDSGRLHQVLSEAIHG